MGLNSPNNSMLSKSKRSIEFALKYARFYAYNILTIIIVALFVVILMNRKEISPEKNDHLRFNVNSMETVARTFQHDQAPYTNKKCKYKTVDFIQSMKNTQRRLNKVWRNLTKTADERWDTMSEVFEPAVLGYRMFLEHFVVSAKGEEKHYLRLNDPNAPCNAITMGVGGMWDVEQLIQKKYPQCNFLGVDPDEEYRKLVESNPRTKYVTAAVYEKAGNFSASVLCNKGGYYPEFIRHEAFADLVNMVGNENGKTVDFMSIDIEGAEFSILRLLHAQRHSFHTICQFNVELHYAKENYNITLEQFDSLLGDFLNEAHFVLLRVSNFGIMRGLYFLNVSDKECIQKFLC